MTQLKWTLQAIREREAIVDYIGQANEMAALEPFPIFENQKIG